MTTSADIILHALFQLSRATAPIDASRLGHLTGQSATQAAEALLQLEQRGWVDASRARLTLLGLARAVQLDAGGGGLRHTPRAAPSSPRPSVNTPYAPYPPHTPHGPFIGDLGGHERPQPPMAAKPEPQYTSTRRYERLGNSGASRMSAAPASASSLPSRTTPDSPFSIGACSCSTPTWSSTRR